MDSSEALTVLRAMRKQAHERAEMWARVNEDGRAMEANQKFDALGIAIRAIKGDRHD
jgi:hypothetical protein